jgi:hypothetical protein
VNRVRHLRLQSLVYDTPYARIVLLAITAQVSSGDLGYLLHKNPARLHSFDLPFGEAHVFYPELARGRAQVALLVDVDPVGLVRGRAHGGGEGSLDQYVNDRPYAASSLLSVGISRVFGTALSGRSKERQELAEQALHLESLAAKAEVLTKCHIRYNLNSSWSPSPLDGPWRVAGCGALRSATP